MTERKAKYWDAVQDNIFRLLGVLSEKPDESKTSALISKELGVSPDWVVSWIDRARANGYLILENERGYYVASSYEAFDQWRKEYVIPILTQWIDVLGAMGRSAKARFNRSDAESDFPRLTG